jgi:hypothetical protein
MRIFHCLSAKCLQALASDLQYSLLDYSGQGFALFNGEDSKNLGTRGTRSFFVDNCLNRL